MLVNVYVSFIFFLVQIIFCKCKWNLHGNPCSYLNLSLTTIDSQNVEYCFSLSFSRYLKDSLNLNIVDLNFEWIRHFMWMFEIVKNIDLLFQLIWISVSYKQNFKFCKKNIFLLKFWEWIKKDVNNFKQ